MNKKLTIPALVIGAAIATFGFSTHASATSVSGMLGVDAHGAPVRADANASVNADWHADDKGGMFRGGPDMNGRAVFGTVTAINGGTITISSKSMDKNATTQVTTNFTVNTSASTVVDKNTAASTVSGIAVGDSVMVEGAVSGTTIAATKIHDGVMAKGAPMPGTKGQANLPMGNGQPIVGGKVTAVNGNTITISNTSNVSYTIDVSKAKITKGGITAATASNIAVGDEVLAQGTINGNAVTAVSLVDGAKATTSTSTTANAGFFGKIGSFFKHLFGF